MKPSEVPQRNVKIKILLNSYFNTTFRKAGVERVKKKSNYSDFELCFSVQKLVKALMLRNE